MTTPNGWIRSALLLAAVAFAVHCGPGSETLVPVASDEPTGEDADLDGETGVEVPDEGTGEIVDIPEPDPGMVDCALLDTCPEVDVDPVDSPDAGALPDGGVPAAVVDAGSLDAGRADAGTVPPNPYSVGARLLVRSWTTLRASASASGAVVTSIAPKGGVKDSEHGAGMPLGMLPPGQVVTLVSATQTNGYWKVKFMAATGFMPASRLTVINPAVHPVTFALQPSIRNAFYKNQLHRTLWNKDGAYSSGTCAPTSLAMAARIFGKEPAGLSIEQSIHRSRNSYGVGSDHVGTNRFQIRAGALSMGLTVLTYSTVASPSAMLTRIAGQLAKKRVFVLEGEPGKAGAATTYQKAFNRAYAKAGVGRTYTFDGKHSIAVFGRDAATGGYVVADPISEVGVVVLTGDELKDFITRWGGTGNSVWVP